MKPFSFQRLVFVIFAVLLGVLILIVANILEVHGILQAGDVIVFWVGLVVLLFLLGYILVPILLRSTNRLSTDQEYEAFHPGRQAVPEEVWSHTCETIDSLNPCGFKLIGHFRKKSVPSAIAFVTLMQSTDYITIAQAITMLTTTKRRAGESVLAFFTELVDGMEIWTANNRIPNFLPHPRKRFALWLPEVRNPMVLYDYHKRLMERSSGTPKCIKLVGNPAEYLNQHAQADVAHWVKHGYYKLDSLALVYRLTWKGAALIGWSYLWPIRPLRAALRRHRTKKLLRSLEE